MPKALGVVTRLPHFWRGGGMRFHFASTLMILALSLALSACATIFTGSSDTTEIDSTPDGAKCLVGGHGSLHRALL